MKKSLLFAAIAAVLLCGCTRDKTEITNTVKMLGRTYNGVVTLYQSEGDNVNFDQKPDISGDQNIHGFHYFDKKILGKTLDFAKDDVPVMIAYNFNNPIDGMDRYYPEFKSGKVTIQEVEGGFWIYIDAKDKDGKAFFMDVLAQDEFAVGGWGKYLD